MPLQPRPIAVKIAVLFFFVFSLAGTLAGLCPYTCCKRAVLGALAAYFLSVVIVKIINIFLFDTIVSKLVKKYQDERNNG
jgi:hypothetical protein